MCKTFKSWRLYSCRRFICTSKIDCGSKNSFCVASSHAAKSSLFFCLISESSRKTAGSSACFSRFFKIDKSVSQPLPAYFDTNAARRGFAFKSQRRCVMPFVLLLNLAGYKSAQSFNSFVRKISECRAATPFTLKQV